MSFASGQAAAAATANVFTEYHFAPGITVWITHQTKPDDCGPCCIALVLRQVGHPQAGIVTVEELRQASQQFPYGYHASPRAVPGAVWTPLALVGPRPVTGTGTTNLATVLSERFFAASGDRPWVAELSPTTKALKQWFRQLGTHMPAICHVRWENGEGHFVVCVGAGAAKDAAAPGQTAHRPYWFSDPSYGLQRLYIPHEDNGTRLTYQPTTAMGGEAGPRGRFTGWVVYQSQVPRP